MARCLAASGNCRRNLLIMSKWSCGGTPRATAPVQAETQLRGLAPVGISDSPAKPLIIGTSTGRRVAQIEPTDGSRSRPRAIAMSAADAPTIDHGFLRAGFLFDVVALPLMR